MIVTDQTAESGSASALDQWLERLADRHLPLLPSSRRLLSALRPESGVPIDRLCGDLATDPGAMLEILRRANSNRQRNLGSRVSTLENAALMLGVEQLGALAQSMPRLAPEQAGPDERHYLQLLSRSYFAGLLAHRWAKIRGDRIPKEVFVAAALHDVGELALALHGGAEELRRIANLQRLERMPADEAQYVVLGFSLEQLSLGLGRRWNLPELLMQSLEAEYAQQPRVLGVMLATQLARLAQAGWYEDELAACVDNAAQWLEVAQDQLASEVHLQAVEAARDTEHLAPLAAARRLPMLPGEEPPSEDEDAGGAGPEPDAPVHFCLMPQWAVYDQVAAELEQFVPGEINLHDLMVRIMRGLHDGLGLNRVVFAMLSRDRGTLQARYLAGTDNDPAFSQFKLQLDRPHLFKRILEREQAVWVHEGNHAKLWPLVPESVQRLIETDTFFAASVVIDEKPVGLFYADRHLPDSRLDEKAYQRFKRLCQLSTAAIARLRSQ